MAENLQGQEITLPFLLKCGKMRLPLTHDDPLPCLSPTSDYNTFIRSFRDTAKHPTRTAFGIPLLPSRVEVSQEALLGADYETDSDSELDPQPSRATSSRGRVRGRSGWSGKDKNKVKKKSLRAFFLESMKSIDRDGVLLFLYRRCDSYLIGIRDHLRWWWDFSSKGGKDKDKLFAGVNSLGFGESYQDMSSSKTVKIGIQQLIHAFNTFYNPEESSDKDLKLASRVMMAFTSEGGRSIILSDDFAEAFTSESSVVELVSGKQLLITSWGWLSGIIIEKYESNKGDDEVETVLCHDPVIVAELTKKRVIKMKDAHLAFGFLLSKSETSLRIYSG